MDSAVVFLEILSISYRYSLVTRQKASASGFFKKVNFSYSLLMGYFIICFLEVLLLLLKLHCASLPLEKYERIWTHKRWIDIASMLVLFVEENYITLIDFWKIKKMNVKRRKFKITCVIRVQSVVICGIFYYDNSNLVEINVKHWFKSQGNDVVTHRNIYNKQVWS